MNGNEEFFGILCFLLALLLVGMIVLGGGIIACDGLDLC